MTASQCTSMDEVSLGPKQASGPPNKHGCSNNTHTAACTLLECPQACCWCSSHSSRQTCARYAVSAIRSMASKPHAPHHKCSAIPLALSGNSGRESLHQSALAADQAPSKSHTPLLSNRPSVLLLLPTPSHSHSRQRSQHGDTWVLPDSSRGTTSCVCPKMPQLSFLSALP
jgi:hypothetical protein